MLAGLSSFLQALNPILTAAIGITALSLWLYALAFNLRDRVALSFALILLALVATYGGESLGSVAQGPEAVPALMLGLLGVTFLPPTYLHFSDALLATTGRPSRGRRRWLVRLYYLLAAGFAVALWQGWVVQPALVMHPAPHLPGAAGLRGFALFYAVGMGWALVNIWRAYRRTVMRTSRRRILLIFFGALAPAVGSFPFLTLGSGFAAAHPFIFWLSATVNNLLVSVLLVLWAYEVAFFGTSWPDRVVRMRLLRWLLRGPVTVATVLMLTTFVRRWGALHGQPYTAAVPVTMVLTFLFLEHFIGVLLPYLEDLVLTLEGGDTLRLLRGIEDRIFTRNDLRQFLEAVLAAVCDLLRVRRAFVAAADGDQLELLGEVGGLAALPDRPFTTDRAERHGRLTFYRWDGYAIVPLRADDGTLLGLLGFAAPPGQTWDEEQLEALETLAERATMALEDWRLRRQLSLALQAFRQRTDLFPRLRAAARFDQRRVLTPLDELPPSAELAQWVKDALAHYWGGPKLTENPLLRLEVVRRAAEAHEGNTIQGLRSVLRQAIDQLRPEGERRFTTEWLLYNILELKFLQGRKAREVAARLALSEADLYRKQRVALQEVARVLLEMERRAREGQPAAPVQEENARGSQDAGS